MNTIKKPRRVVPVRVEEEGPTLLPDYLENIVGDIYLTVNSFENENYFHIRRFFTDRDGILRPRKDGCSFTKDQLAIFIDLLRPIESRYWSMEEGMALSEYEQYRRPVESYRVPIPRWRDRLHVSGQTPDA